MARHRHLVASVLTLFLAFLSLSGASGGRKVNFRIRGVDQTLYLYSPASPRGNSPAVIVLSGDGGWHGLAIEIAEHLAASGYPALGVDSKEYLASLSRPHAIEPAQVTADVSALAHFAMSETGAKRAVLVGWSEGAALAVLGGLDISLRTGLHGVVAVGLPEFNELAWRTSDAIIYITKKVPNEPTFNSKEYIGKVAPIPLMIIQSTRDDFVPVATAREIFTRAQDPKQIVWLDARNHRFDGQRDAFWQALDRALDWFQTLAPSSPR